MAQTRVRVKVARGGRLVIPAPIRKAMELEDGDTVSMEFEDGRVTITTRQEALRRAQAWVRSLPGYDPTVSLAEELIAERRIEAQREDE